jgi:transposase
MSKKPRRFFTTEQKAEAVNIVQQSGKPVSQVARELGLTESALCQWVKQSQSNAQPKMEGTLTLFCHSGRRDSERLIVSFS